MSDKFINDDAHNENEKKKNNKAKLIIIFFVVFTVVFLGVYFGMQLFNQYMVDKPATTQPTTIAPTNAASDENEKQPNPIDFETLQSGNDDIYAYIIIDDTNVNYPIVQSPSDDSFYLKHKAEDKSWSASGAVYTELVNSKDFGDRVTVIYGHNGYGDTFFTTLHKFEDEEFFTNHPYYYIYTPDRKLTYQVISAFKYDDRHIMNSFNFSINSTFLDFEQMLLNPNSALKNVRTELDTTLDETSNIVVLSTCVTNQKSSRYLVCGVLVKDEQTY